MASGSDDFNRANGAPGYTTLSGYNAFSIVSNVLRNTSTSDAGLVVATQAADCMLQADYVWSTTGAQAGSLNIRMASNSSTADCYRLLYANANANGGTTVLALNKRISGTDTALVRNGVNQTQTLAEGAYTFKIAAIGPWIFGVVNGVITLWGKDSTITAAGLGTVECYNSTASAISVDNIAWADQSVTLVSDNTFGTGGWRMYYSADGAEATTTTARAVVYNPGANNNVDAYNTVQGDEVFSYLLRNVWLGAGRYVWCGGTDTTPVTGYLYGNGAGNNTSIASVRTAMVEAARRYPNAKMALASHSAGTIAIVNAAKLYPTEVACIVVIDGAGDVDYQVNLVGAPMEDLLNEAYAYDSLGTWDANKADRDPYLISQNNTYWVNLRRIPVLHYRANTDSTFDDTGQDRLRDSWGAQFSQANLAGTHMTIHYNVDSAAVLTFLDNANWTSRLRPVVVLTDNRAITASASPVATFTRAPLTNDIVDVAPSSTGITVTLQAVTGWVNVLGGTTDVESDSHQIARLYHVVTSGEGGSTTSWTLTSLYSAAQTGNITSWVLADVDPNNPMDVATSTFNSTNTVTPHVLPGLTPTTTNGLMTSVVAKDGTGAYSTAPTGWNLRVTSNTNQGKAMLDMIAYTSAGVAVASTNITPSAGDEYASISVIWRAAAAAPGFMPRHRRLRPALMRRYPRS